MSRQIKLVTPHTHNGVLYNAGETIELEEVDAVWYNEAVVHQRSAIQHSASAKILKEAMLGPPVDPYREIGMDKDYS